MNLNTNKWKEFVLEDLFYIEAGKYRYPDEYDKGKTPYVSASNIDNGINQTIDITPDFKGNCITTGKVGCTAFYQPNDFCATSDVNIFRPKNFTLNEKIGLFIVSIINMSENYKWSYGRQCRIGDSKKIIIKLPILINKNNNPIIDEKYIYSKYGYQPDFNFMESYIDSLNSKQITTKNKEYINLKNNIEEWKEFKIKDLFNVSLSGGDLKLNECEPGNIHLISSGQNNNGVVGNIYVEEENKAQKFQKNQITVDMFCNAFYQNESFFSVSHGRVNILEPKFKMNKFTALFITTLINKENFKYSYGRAVYSNEISRMILKMPILLDINQKPIFDINNTFSPEGYIPDFKYMEEYIKSLPYGDRI